MKTAYVIFAREKAHHAEAVELCVRSAFAQTYAPMEIVLSDQGSTDGTLELLKRLAAEYTGPNTVRVLECPDVALRGMAGLNAHLAWLHETLDCEIFIATAADDYADPQRAARIVEAFERTGADMVGGAMYVEDPLGQVPKRRSSFKREGWVTVRDCVESKVGGSSAPAWRRDLWARLAPIPPFGSPDVWMPPMAAALGGFWFINEPLYTRLDHADPKNTGLEGVLRALPENQRRPVDEYRLFQTAQSWQWVARCMTRLGIGNADDHNCVQRMALAHYEAWADVRTAMTLDREAPQPLPI